MSVVIPVYNGEGFVRDAVASAFAQTETELEVIVVDDGSTDATERVVREGTPRARYERQEHRGVAAARNRGVSVAQGEWIAFLDADDLWYPRKLEVQREALRRCPDSGLVYCDFDAVDAGGTVVVERAAARGFGRWHGMRHPLEVAAFGSLPFPYPSTVVVRKDLLESTGGFDPAFARNYHEDFEAFARLFPVASPHFVSEALVRYFARPWRWTPEWSSNWLLLLDRLSALWRDEPDKQRLLVEEYARHFAREGTRCLYEHDWEGARGHLRRALDYSPRLRRARRRILLSHVPILRELYALRKATSRRGRW